LELIIFTQANSTVNSDDDEEICSILNCDCYKNLQLQLRYNFKKKDNDEYCKNIRKYVYNFVNGNKTAIEALDGINGLVDLDYINQTTLNTEELSNGLKTHKNIIYLFIYLFILFCFVF